MNARPEFKIVCVNCDSLGVMLDFPEGAPSCTLIKCSNCKTPRGTLGDLRNLASSDKRDLFEL
jgi:LSD1 subclass zinc finger protein